jgi:hypothetical protein
VGDLVLRAEDVGIVLLESPDTGQTSEGARRLIAMKDTKVGHSDRQLPVASLTVLENQAMSGAIHGLQSPLLLFHVESEHILRVMLPVTGDLPEFRAVHVRRANLLIAPLPVLLAQEGHQSVVDDHTVRQEET